MCGILAVKGKYRYDAIPDALIERGVDDSGIYEDDYVQLIQTRLEITPCKVELPFQDEEYVLLFNGEIYNWKEIIKEYDVKNEYEAIIAAFKHYGSDLKEYLDGQFSILIYRKKNNMLYFFQDDFKIHKVYYIEYNGSIIYASNLRSLPNLELKALQSKGYGNISSSRVL